MTKVEIKILQGSAVAETVQGRLVIYPLLANLFYYMPAKKYEN